MIFYESRYLVLEALYLAQAGVSAGVTGVGVRELGMRTRLSVGAIQTALNSLQADDLIVRIVAKNSNRELYALKQNTWDYELISCTVKAAREVKIRRQAEVDSNANRLLLKQIDELRRLAISLQQN
jgi:hypothetical protein